MIADLLIGGAVGLVGGVASGLTGTSPGGALVVLSSLLLGAEQHVAQGISLIAQVPPTSLPGIARYRADGARTQLLKGTWEIQQSQFSAAEKTFTLARSLVEPSSGFAQIADNALADIKLRNGGTSAGGNGAEPTANGAPLAAVQLQLGAEARKAATSSSAVFLIVRAAGADRGPPLAAKRIDVGALDQPVSLTAADAMIGGAGLKAGVEVSLQARLSINGQPTAQTGDWQSQKASTRLPATTTLSIDQRLSQ